jgi:hypothetical protein
MYPPRNPFPAQATAIIEGSLLGDLEQLTLARPALDRLSNLVDQYRRSYSQATNDNGRAIVVHGEHGSGKTHALGCAMLALLAPEEGPLVRILYVRADSPDMLSMYRKLMSQISLHELQGLARLTMAQFPEGVRAALGKTAADSDWVTKAFQAAELQETAVLDRQSSDLAREGMRQKDFERVVLNLLNRDLDERAHRWLTGEELTEPDLRALGITGNIDDPLKIRAGIQTLLILSKRVGQPVAILIDQGEALVTAEDGTLSIDNVGTLRSILEGMIGNSGLLLLAIREATWRVLPLDLRQRFGPSEFQLTGLTQDEATDLVALYVKPWVTDEEPATYPILPDGLREALVGSGGNIRRFIQLCSLLFTVAAPEERPIDGDFARNVLSAQTNPVPTAETIRERLTESLAAAHVPFLAEFSLGPDRVDFAIKSAAGGFRAFVVITDALVGARELRVAQRTLNLVQEAQILDQLAEVVLVIGGYMSPELTTELSKVHRVLIVTSETIQSDLTALVADLSTPVPAAPVPETSLRQLDRMTVALVENRQQLDQVTEALAALAANRSQLDEVAQAIAELAKDRDRQWSSLARQVTELNLTHGAQRETDEVAGTALRWRTAEEDLRDRIRSVRADRRQAELRELEQLRAKAERDSQRWSAATALPYLLAGVALLAVNFSTHRYPLSILLPIAAGLVAIAFTTPLLFNWHRNQREGDLRRPAISVEELNLLARGYLRDRQPPLRRLAPGPFMTLVTGWSSNPQLTYAASLAPVVYSTSRLTQALARERSAIVRRSLVRRLAADSGTIGFRAALDTIGSDPAASAAFDSLEAPSGDLTQPYQLRTVLGASAAEVSLELHTIALIYGFLDDKRDDLGPGSSLLDNFILFGRDDEIPSSLEDDYRRHRQERFSARELRLSYESGSDDKLLATLPLCTERDYRAAVAMLSPFDAGKLGTFDWLDKISEIDEMYVFFRKCLFYLARGIAGFSDQT